MVGKIASRLKNHEIELLCDLHETYWKERVIPGEVMASNDILTVLELYSFVCV